MMRNNTLLLRCYLGLRYLVPLVAPIVTRKRLAKGKEDASRVQEKLGQPTVARPNGRLVWLHAVGLGEVLSLRSLIAALQAHDPALQLLVTSSTTGAAAAIAKQLPANAIHQYLPIDAPQYSKVFLDHWRPDFVIWAEQDIWPGLIHDVAARNIAQVLINARMNATSYAKLRKIAPAIGPSLRRMAVITAQDDATASHILKLGFDRDVRVGPNLKAASPPLDCDQQVLESFQSAINGRRVWVAGAAHPADAEIVIAAHKALLRDDPAALLIIAPRNPSLQIQSDLAVQYRSEFEHPAPDAQVFVVDNLGDMGLVYRLADVAFVGGTMTDIEGHNPWEAAALGCHVLHGPRTANFRADYKSLDDHGAAVLVHSAAEIITALATLQAASPEVFIADARRAVGDLAQELLQLEGTS